jgi:putative SOS response-associated peptidase YedK
VCGRYNVIDDPFLRELMRDLGIDAVLPTMINVAPTETVPIVIETGAGRELRYMRWWLTPSWSDGPSTQYSMFNAKSETIANSRAFRTPFRRRRGIVPASSFIEWQTDRHGKQPWLIKPEAGAFAFAAIWDHWQKDEVVVESCALITTDAVPGFATIHQRMPVILSLDDYAAWLDPQRQIDKPEHFFKPRLPAPVRIAPLDKAVNNARNKDLALLQPVAEGELIRN